MIQITLEQAQTHLATYIERVAQGETVIITREDQPIADLRPLAPPSKKPRPIGLAKGTFEVPPSFFEPLPDDLLDAFEGKGS